MKLETQGLLAGSLHKIWYLNHRNKIWLTDRREWVLINFRMLISKSFSSMNCRFIELKAFSKSIFKILFLFGWGRSIKQRKTCEVNSPHFFVPSHRPRRPPYLAWRYPKTWYPAHFADNRQKVLPTAIGRSPPSGFLAQLVSHQRSTAEVRKVLGTFPSRISLTRFVKALRKFSSVSPFDLAVKSFKIWGEMPSNSALEPLGKVMRALWTKNSEAEKQSYLWGPEQSKFPFADVSAWGQRSCRP